MIYLDQVKLSDNILNEINKFLNNFNLNDIKIIIANVNKKEFYWMQDNYLKSISFPGNDVFRAWSKSNQNTIIIFQDQAEIELSIFWLIIHEITHLKIRTEWSLIYNTLRIETEILRKKLNISEEDYLKREIYDNDLRNNDPEEVLCDRIANAIIGEVLDRNWWKNRINNIDN